MFMAASVAIIASCDDDTTPVLELENAASLNAINPSEYVISKDNYAEQFPEISWEKASYGKGAIVNYELPSPTTPHRRASLSVKQPTTRSSTSPMSR